MATVRAFSYNSGSTIFGASQVGNLSISPAGRDYSGNYGGVKWWMGPNEDLGYVIAHETIPPLQPTEIPGVTAAVGFWRSPSLTDDSFLETCNTIPPRVGYSPFTTVTQCLAWLAANGYWTSYPQAIDAFVANIDTSGSDNYTISLPYSSSATYSGTIDWGDGTITSNSYANRSHIYVTGGKYSIIVDGQIGSYNHGDNPNTLKSKLTSISSFGSNFSFGSDVGGYFYACIGLRTIASDIPISGITNMASMFESCYHFNQNLNEWDVSSVTNMVQMFYSAYDFNGNISGWNVSNVTNMRFMLSNARVFNINISNWNVSKVTNMGYMFYQSYLFNQDISDWNVGQVTDMSGMLLGSSFTSANLNLIYTTWSTLPSLKSNVLFGAPVCYDSSASSGRSVLTGTYNWTISDLGQC